MNLLRDLYSRVFKSKKPPVAPKMERLVVKAPDKLQDKAMDVARREYEKYKREMERKGEKPRKMRSWAIGLKKRPRWVRYETEGGTVVHARHFGTFSPRKPFHSQATDLSRGGELHRERAKAGLDDRQTRRRLERSLRRKTA